MQNFDWTFSAVGEGEAASSILATVAKPFAYAFAPIIGYVSWQLAAAAITGFIAKENVVGTLAVSFAITNLVNADELVLEEGANVSLVAQAFGTGSGAAMMAAAGLAYLCFNLFSPPCFAAIGAMNAEIGNKKWLFAGIALQIAVGYSLGFLINFFGTLFTGASFGAVWMPIVGWSVVLACAAICTYLSIKNARRTASVAKATVTV
jgi:ferrous iron transport protein B